MTKDELFAQLSEDLSTFSIYSPHGSSRSYFRALAPLTCVFARDDESITSKHYFRVVTERCVLSLGLDPSTSEEDAVAFLDAVQAVLPSEAPTGAFRVVYPARGLGNCNAACVMEPRVSREIPVKKALYMLEVGYSLYPCFRCELSDSDEDGDLAIRIRNIKPGNVQRSPQPAMQMRYALHNGMRSAGGSKMGIWRFEKEGESVMFAVTQCAQVGGTIVLENWEDARFTLLCEEGRWTISEKRGRAVMPIGNDILPWLHAFAFESREAAMKLTQS